MARTYLPVIFVWKVAQEFCPRFPFPHPGGALRVMMKKL